MKKTTILILVVLLNSSMLFSQVAINTDGSAPDASAGLDMSFTNKGFLPPRMTQDQISAISNPADGLQIYCTTDSKMYIFVSAINAWRELAYDSGLISPPFITCGMPLTKYHVTGSIAPVNKLVTYGTVTNIPGETSKCWITSNLGANHQATAVDDTTEASAGWYWQFNRMQGYKHNGLTRTPNTTWIINIDEISDWLTANDPCALLLGSGWRLPTSTEWINIDAIGGWTDWNGPWDSDLKMHAAGYLHPWEGSLYRWAGQGHYWSSTRIDWLNQSDNGYHFSFHSLNCQIEWGDKACGFSVRCLRD